MTTERVIVRIRGSGLPAEPGEILDKLDDGGYLVRWPSGTEELVRTGNVVRLVERGSLRFQSLVDPDGLRERFGAAPSDVVLDLLRESRGALNVRAIKDALVALGLDKKSADASWPAIKKVIDKHPNVIRRLKPPAYNWTAEPIDPLAALRATRPVDALNRIANGKPAPDEREILIDVVRAGAAQDPVLATVAAAAGLVLDAAGEWPAPLTAAARLGELDEGVVEAALTAFGDEFDGRQLAAVLATPRRRGADWPLASVDATRMGGVIEAFCGELTSRDTDAAVQRLVATFVERVVSGCICAEVPFEPLAMLCHAVVPKLGRDHLAAIDELLSCVAARLGEAEDASAIVDHVKRAAGRLPLTPDGGRAAAINAVSRLQRDRLADAGWWQSVSLEQLAAASRTIADVLNDDRIAAVAVKPVLDRALAEAADRVALARLVGLPAVIARLVAPIEMRAAWRRVAREDGVAETWLAALGDDGRIADLEQAADEERRAAGAANERAAAAVGAASELQERLAVLEGHLRGQAQSAADLHARQRRQARIDALRALALLAVEAQMLLHPDSDGLAAGAIQAIVKPEGLERVGAPDERVVFDPRRHEVLVGEPATGAPALVVRPGYVLREPSQDSVLVKALVRPV